MGGMYVGRCMWDESRLGPGGGGGEGWGGGGGGGGGGAGAGGGGGGGGGYTTHYQVRVNSSHLQRNDLWCTYSLHVRVNR